MDVFVSYPCVGRMGMGSRNLLRKYVALAIYDPLKARVTFETFKPRRVKI